MFTSFKRILRSGWISFLRNSGLSTATIFIIVIIISLITFLFLSQGVVNYLINFLQEKVDISVYFKEDSLTEDVLKIKDELSKFSEVKSIEYISSEEALERFKEKHKDNPIIIESLEEVGKNPFLSSINIKAFNPEQYEIILNYLKDSQFNGLIEKIDYYQRKPIIEKLFFINSTVNKTGVIFSVILSLIAILVAFNMVKLAIYSSREEIKMMRLVGASSWFIRGPFMIQGAIVGIFSVLITILIFSLLCFFLTPKLQTLLVGFNLFEYFTSNFFTILLIQIIAGVGLGIIPSMIAIRRYIRV